MRAVLDEVVAAFRGVLGSRLVAVAVHGSAVTGDFFPGVSDVDFAVVLDSRLDLRDSVAIAASIETVEVAPFAYMQATYHEAGSVVPSVVPGAFSVLHGDLDNGFVHTAESLRSAGVIWLEELPRLVNQDTKDWSVAVARRPRQFRLILTRLKPTVRAHLVTWCDDPITAYRNPWPVLVDSLRVHEPSLASDISSVLSLLRAPGLDLLDTGALLLGLLVRLADLPGEGSSVIAADIADNTPTTIGNSRQGRRVPRSRPTRR